MHPGNAVLLALLVSTADAASRARAGRWWPFTSSSDEKKEDGGLLRGLKGQPESEIWNYHDNGMDWKMGECCVGNSQSPVNVSETPAAQAENGNVVLFHGLGVYKHPVFLKNDGRGLAATLEKAVKAPWIGLGESVGGLSDHWELEQILIHSPSEHTFEGKRVPLELQLVHRKASNSWEVQGPGSSYAVLAVGYIQSDETSELLDALREGGLPTSAGTTVMANREPSRLKLEEVMGTSGFWQYQGSLTAPPCSVGVQWFVRDTALPASGATLRDFQNAVHASASAVPPGAVQLAEEIKGGNARGFQPTCGRAKLLRMPRSSEGENPSTLAGASAANKSEASQSSDDSDLEEQRELLAACEQELSEARLELQARQEQQEAECSGEVKAKEQLEDAGQGALYMRASVKVSTQHQLCESEKKVVAALKKQITLQEDKCHTLKI